MKGLGDRVDQDELTLVVALGGLNVRLRRFLVDTADRDAPRPDSEAWVQLGQALSVFGGAVQRHARLRSASWGHTPLEPGLGHVRSGRGKQANCGALLTGDLASTEVADVCPECLAGLGSPHARG